MTVLEGALLSLGESIGLVSSAVGVLAGVVAAVCVASRESVRYQGRKSSLELSVDNVIELSLDSAESIESLRDCSRGVTSVDGPSPKDRSPASRSVTALELDIIEVNRLYCLSLETETTSLASTGIRSCYVELGATVASWSRGDMQGFGQRQRVEISFENRQSEYRTELVRGPYRGVRPRCWIFDPGRETLHRDDGAIARNFSVMQLMYGVMGTCMSHSISDWDTRGVIKGPCTFNGILHHGLGAGTVGVEQCCPPSRVNRRPMALYPRSRSRHD